jgi:hypothetical protein
VLWTLPLLAVTAVAVWQWATVRANYGDNWTALFCTGSLQRHPPLVSSEHVYVFANSTGYDGQFYHYIAHDPFMRSGLKTFIDDARLRYRRILVPFLAHGLALGHPEWIDPAYEAVFLLSVGLGVYWSCRVMQAHELPVVWGLVFLVMPAVPISMDRLVIDGALAALAVGFLVYSPQPSWKLFLVLVSATLVRETGFLLLLAYTISLVMRRLFSTAAVFLLGVVPALAWYGYVQTQTVGHPYEVRFANILKVFSESKYPAGIPFTTVIQAADYLALAGILLAFGLGMYLFSRSPSDPVRGAAFLFASLGLTFLCLPPPDPLQSSNQFRNVYDFGRIYTPLLLCLAAVAAQRRSPWLLAPCALMLPRITIQLVPQILGVIRWFTSG